MNVETAPATDLAHQWNGWGTALKPAWEPIVVAMKPCDGTFAENAEKWGVAGLNIDGGRIYVDPHTDKAQLRMNKRTKRTVDDGWGLNRGKDKQGPMVQSKGRWPANVILDEDTGRMLDEQSGDTGNKWVKNYGVDYAEQRRQYDGGVFGGGGYLGETTYCDTGGASRFFYCAKASRSERTCDGKVENKHPTVKPLSLMEYLCRLTATPTGGVVLDPFMGSGSTGIAALRTGRKFIGIEKDQRYFKVARTRIKHNGG